MTCTKHRNQVKTYYKSYSTMSATENSALKNNINHLLPLLSENNWWLTKSKLHLQELPGIPSMFTDCTLPSLPPHL